MAVASSTGTFESLGLGPELLRAVQVAGYERPTAVQSAAIPAVLAGRDLLARAHTGSGKTAAFGLPLLQHLLARPRPRNVRGNSVAVLVLAPTRELVAQLAGTLEEFAESLTAELKVNAVFGGPSINPQMLALRGGADIVVATPGRLLELRRKNAVAFDSLRALVLDEADRMLSLGFRAELEEVLSLLPARRQNLLFSATFPEHVTQLAHALLREPIEVDATQAPAERAAPNVAPDIEQHAYAVDQERKSALLIHLLEQRDLPRVLVFVSAKKTADALARKLIGHGLRAAAFHGDKSQGARTQALADFRSGTLRVLIATDLAARGIDIPDLPAVINFELPRSPNDYVHRIGRTGRAGRTGLALSLICAAEDPHFRVIQKRMKQSLPREEVAGFERIADGGRPQ
ncbi:MAG TPA: DEAD/DEAH box helicase [Polyangiales bacterium]|jgi:superfamily II DNA/RNA helicase|nr:DEAD/DEAH box helicase [Polyangiales bacterium]